MTDTSNLSKAVPPTASAAERLLRQTQLKEIGEAGRQRIAAARFLVIGAGGLGSPALLVLAASGAKHITVADFDAVAVSNLSRQFIHAPESVGVNKAQSAAQTLPRFNPEVEVEAVEQAMDSMEALLPYVERADVVLDCTDNLASRQLINRACFQAKKPLVFGAAVRYSGQVSVFDFRRSDSPCFRCLFDEDDAANDEKAAVFGVFTPLTSIVGTLQAAEALKIAAGIGESLAGRLLLVDLLTMEFQVMRVKRRAGCPLCGSAHEN